MLFLFIKITPLDLFQSIAALNVLHPLGMSWADFFSYAFQFWSIILNIQYSPFNSAEALSNISFKERLSASPLHYTFQPGAIDRKWQKSRDPKSAEAFLMRINRDASAVGLVFWGVWPPPVFCLTTENRTPSCGVLFPFWSGSLLMNIIIDVMRNQNFRLGVLHPNQRPLTFNTICLS